MNGKTHKKYRNDKDFYDLVSAIEAGVASEAFSLGDVREAVDFISSRHKIQSECSLGGEHAPGTHSNGDYSKTVCTKCRINMVLP